MFPQADEGFVLLENPETNELNLRSTRSRHGSADRSSAIAATIGRYGSSSARVSGASPPRIPKTTAFATVGARQKRTAAIVHAATTTTTIVSLITSPSLMNKNGYTAAIAPASHPT
jgi:hypothetical protein